ncbi:MAG: mRNA surveillance protein Pelota [Candidatus Woesearchaeota archaeon]|nr:MAG: mRNA surveillance protein Pelota [Candidatus Woesearchaeota archaeon]
MKILTKDLKHGIIKIKVDSSEDLFYLEKIIEPKDLVSGMTERKIKLSSSEEKSKVSRVPVFLKIQVEKVLLEDALRISGPIIAGPEDIPKGDYHSFNVLEGSIITIEKANWGRYFLKKIDEATKQSNSQVLIVAFDREEAIFALLRNNGYEILLNLKGDVVKKGFEDKKNTFYNEIIEKIKDYNSKYEINNIILASPAFWKEYLIKEIDDDSLRKKITLATCSGIDGSTINEILRRPELSTILDKDKTSRENSLIEELLQGIRTENAAYGIEEVINKIDSGNISVLLLSENFIRKMREDKQYSKIDFLISNAESVNAEVKIIGSEDAMKKLDGLSGIACLLRWKENY